MYNTYTLTNQSNLRILLIEEEEAHFMDAKVAEGLDAPSHFHAPMKKSSSAKSKDILQESGEDLKRGSIYDNLAPEPYGESM